MTVKNTGNKNIRYVKVNIFMYDSNNNIIDSYWTNSSSLIKPGAKLELEKMIPYKDNYENATMNAEIADMRFD
nr:FxLYD domain-containing protein [Clostridium frigidicarnis]